MTEEEFKMNLLLLGFVYVPKLRNYRKDTCQVLTDNFPSTRSHIFIYIKAGKCTAYDSYQSAINYLINN